jgi:hypothetical protein
MRIGAVVVVGLMVAAGGQAQTSSPLNARAIPIEAKCPGQLRVQHQPTGGATVWTVAQEDKDRDGKAREVKGPGVHVEFEVPKNKVQMLELSVSYLPAAARVVPVEPGMDSRGGKESKKTFVLQLEAARRVAGDLLVGRVVTITRVHLVSATFADGSVWRASGEDECSVPPDLYMPVEAMR